MLLCDVGNTSFHFFDGEKDYKESVEHFNSSSIKEIVYYICVNPRVKEVLKLLKNWVDLSVHVDMSNYYETMGIDRIMACEAIQDGIIVDAGSAITVDIVKNGVFYGGFIYPGVNAMSETYTNISSALNYPFNFDIDLSVLPKNSVDSISYGYLKTLQSEVLSLEGQVYLTGGDSDKFTNIFNNAIVDKRLIFKGMKTTITT